MMGSATTMVNTSRVVGTRNMAPSSTGYQGGYIILEPLSSETHIYIYIYIYVFAILKNVLKF
jgi:hypothetical protein